MVEFINQKGWCKARDCLLAAILAISIITILEYSGFNSVVNASTLKLALNLLRLQNQIEASVVTENAAASLNDAKGMPVVVLLSEVLYETHFNQSSPLDRKKLNEIIKLIADGARSKVQLVIDLDLSPVYQVETSDGSEIDKIEMEYIKLREKNERELYDTLKSVVEGNPRGVILTTPAPIATPESYMQKRGWMIGMCDAGVRYGLPYLYEIEGVVMKRSQAKESLAETAKCGNKAGEVGEVGEVGEAGEADVALCNKICDGVKKGSDYSLDYLWLKPPPDSTKLDLEIINANYFKDYRVIDVHSIEQLKAEWSAHTNALSSSDLVTVFIGGSYGHTDRYLSARGEQPGVILHAAGFYSAHNPVKELSSFTSWLVGIVFAIAGGYLLILAKEQDHTWVMSVVSETVLPIVGFVLLSGVLAFSLKWNVAFSAAIVTESAWLFSNIYPCLKSKEGYAKDSRCVVFQSNISTVSFWVILVLAVTMMSRELIGL